MAVEPTLVLPRSEMKNTIVLDLGGTWFRAALCDQQGRIIHSDKRRSINYLSSPALDVADLQTTTVEYILAEVTRLEPLIAPKPEAVSVSFGAAVNGWTGEIVNASQLWGPDSSSFELLAAVRDARPDLRWTLVNDVTALAAHFALEMPEVQGRLCVMTISTGIGARTIDVPSASVRISSPAGLQGEIGHLPIDFSIGGVALELACDCGSMNHLNAFSSGRGIARVMRRMGEVAGRPQWVGAEPGTDAWAGILNADLRSGHPLAVSLLDAVTKPIARAVGWIVTIDPEVERVVICGGVAMGLAPFFETSVRTHIQNEPLYLQSQIAGERGEKLVHFAPISDEAGLKGAAVMSHPKGNQPLETAVGLGQTRWRVLGSRIAEYEVVVTQNDGPRLLMESLTSFESHRATILVDGNVPREHLTRYAAVFANEQLRPYLTTVPADEKEKGWGLVEKILRHLEVESVPRRGHPVVALGGGALLDAVGLAAGLYRRGIPYIRVPTTLLGLVDAGIGVKVGVNAFSRKNRLGLFNPPAAVVCDLQFVSTLPRQQMVSALGEILKIALVADRRLFDELRQWGNVALTNEFYATHGGLSIVERSVGAMLGELSGNLWESQLERSVDLGHSMSQFLETGLDPALSHGEAVAVDIALTLAIGLRRGITPRPVVDRVLELMRNLNLPFYEPRATADALWSGLQDTERHRGGKQRMPMLLDIGEPPLFVSDVEQSEIEAAVDWLLRHCW